MGEDYLSRLRRCSVRVGENASDVSIILDDGTDLVKRIPVDRIRLTIQGPNEPAELVVHISRPHLSAENVRWMVPESDLRWLADAHGYRLVKSQGGDAS